MQSPNSSLSSDRLQPWGRSLNFCLHLLNCTEEIPPTTFLYRSLKYHLLYSFPHPPCHTGNLLEHSALTSLAAFTTGQGIFLISVSPVLGFLSYRMSHLCFIGEVGRKRRSTGKSGNFSKNLIFLLAIRKKDNVRGTKNTCVHASVVWWDRTGWG